MPDPPLAGDSSLPDRQDVRVFYFGCYGPQPGHGYHKPGGRRARLNDHGVANGDWGIGPWDKVDGHLAPRQWAGRRAPEEPQGVAALHHKDGWTALAFWDRTGDRRGASNSNFFFDATLDFDTALGFARWHFPELFDRFDFEVVPRA